MKEPEGEPEVQRSQSDYLNMTRSIAVNHLQTEYIKAKRKPTLAKITAYLAGRTFAWFYYYLVNRFGPKHPFLAYPETDNGVYAIDKADHGASFCIAADWATNTPESVAVANSMAAHKPDYTIHLGDTYYVGAPHEIGQNFTWKSAAWPRGKKGSFALMGNHEMYARGIAYFKKLLPTLGLYKSGKYQGQKASFFCLENEHWRILGLDTGYHSVGKIPLLEMLPWFAPDCHFDEILMDWLRNEVKLNDPADKRGLLILTHHQYISAFQNEGEYLKPAEQLAELIGKEREVVWLFGHEHKFSMYGKAQVNKGITAFGRCIGHGGMPVELNTKEFEKDTTKNGHNKLVMVDKRVKEGTLGFNGYVHMLLKGRDLEINNHDVNDRLVSESWSADNKTGKIKGNLSFHFPKLAHEPGKQWEDAVK